MSPVHFNGGGPLHEYGLAGGNFTDAGVRAAISVGYSWNYLTTTLPAGADSSKLVCLYQFDGPTNGLTDRSGNGHTLTPNRDVFWAALGGSVGINALQVRTNTNIAGPTGLYPGTIGAWTVEWIWSPILWSTDTDFIFSVGGPGSEVEADNFTCRILVNATDGAYGNFHERGAGTNVEGFGAFSGLIGHTQYGAMTRNVDGITHKLYSDGDFKATITLSDPPTGGGSADVVVQVGGDDTANDLYAFLFSIRYTKEEYTAAQILESYQTVRGMI